MSSFAKKTINSGLYFLGLLWLFIATIYLIEFFLFKNYHSPKLPSKLSPSPFPTKTIPFISQISHGSRDLPLIALTFDADMTPFMAKELADGKISSWYNQKIVEILIQKNIPATLFLSGMWVETYPEIAASLAKNPLFEIANHSYSHPRFTSACFALPEIPSWGKTGEFEKSQAIFKKITGITPKYFRFPGGCRTDLDIKLANKYGLTVVDWDVASGDSFNRNSPAIINTVKTKTQNGSIILFHFDGQKNSPETSNVLPELIDYLSAKGYIFVNLTDLLFSLGKAE